MGITFNYFVLLGSLILLLSQIYLSLSYLKKFVYEYLSNISSSWDPNHDRLILFMSLLFGIISYLLTKEIWLISIESSWYLTFLYFVIVFLLFYLTFAFIQSIAKKNIKVLNKSNDKKVEIIINSFSQEKELTKNKLNKIFEEFLQYELISDSTTLDDFLYRHPKINLTNADFYLFHKYYYEKIDNKVSLKNFCTKYKNKKGDFFNYNSVRKDGTQQLYPKNESILKEIFSNI